VTVNTAVPSEAVVADAAEKVTVPVPADFASVIVAPDTEPEAVSLAVTVTVEV
jgi:hypothetical protein